MTLPHIIVWQKCSVAFLTQILGDFSQSFPFVGQFRELDEQPVSERFSAFSGVNWENDNRLGSGIV
jgi:hypothetical protein